MKQQIVVQRGLFILNGFLFLFLKSRVVPCSDCVIGQYGRSMSLIFKCFIDRLHQYIFVPSLMYGLSSSPALSTDTLDYFSALLCVIPIIRQSSILLLILRWKFFTQFFQDMSTLFRISVSILASIRNQARVALHKSTESQHSIRQQNKITLQKKS